PCCENTLESSHLACFPTSLSIHLVSTINDRAFQSTLMRDAVTYRYGWACCLVLLRSIKEHMRSAKTDKDRLALADSRRTICPCRLPPSDECSSRMSCCHWLACQPKKETQYKGDSTLDIR
ncbi:hypothetical protein Tcan_01804, partial [Toxocara canis]